MNNILKIIISNRTIFLLVLMFVFSIIATIFLGSKFASLANLKAVMLGQTSIAIMTIGMMALLISGVFDLSVGSIFALGSVFCGYLIKSVGLPYPIAMILALCGCGLLGAVNAFIITKMHVNALITTLATMGIFKGLAIIIGGAGIMGLPKEFIYFGRTDFLGVPSPIWYFLIILVVFSYLFSNVAYFRKYYFVGGNEKAATLSGISVNHIRFTGYILSGLLAGFGGVLHASRLGASIPLAGSGLELQVIAAAVVGGASLVGGKGTIFGGVLGAMFLALVFNVFVITGVSAYWIPVVNGAILILAVYFHVVFKKE